jgi:hypothetical protein
MQHPCRIKTYIYVYIYIYILKRRGHPILLPDATFMLHLEEEKAPYIIDEKMGKAPYIIDEKVGNDEVV